MIIALDVQHLRAEVVGLYLKGMCQLRSDIFLFYFKTSVRHIESSALLRTIDGDRDHVGPDYQN